MGPLSLAGYMREPWPLVVKTYSVYLGVFQKRQDWNHRPASSGSPGAQLEHNAECYILRSRGHAPSHTPGHWGSWFSGLLE